MGFSYSSKLFGGTGAGGSGVGTSLTTQVLFNSSGSVAGDAGLTYDPATDTLTATGGFGSGGVATQYRNIGTSAYIVTDLFVSGANLRVPSSGSYQFSSSVTAYQNPDSGLRRVSPGLVGATSGGSNLGSLQAGNVTATALATPVITSPLTVNGTPGVVTYGYKRVSFLNDGTSTAASAEVTVATGPATLGATDNITVAWPAVTGEAYSEVYRTTGNGALGEVPPRLIYTGTAPTTIDVGAPGTSKVPATVNTTGVVTTATQRIGNGTYLLPSFSFTSDPTSGLFMETASGYEGVAYEGGASPRGIAFTSASGVNQFIRMSMIGGKPTVAFRDSGQLAWSSGIFADGTTRDLFLTRPAAATLQLGAAPNATPVANTLIVGESGAGTNIAGGNGVIQSGAGTGSGAGSTLTFKTPAAHGSDGFAQTQTTRLELGPTANTFTGAVHMKEDVNEILQVGSASTIAWGVTTVGAGMHLYPNPTDTRDIGFSSYAVKNLYLTRATLGSKSKALTDGSATAFATVALADGTMTGGEIIYRVTATISGEKQNLSGRVRYSAIRDNTDYDCDISEVGTQTTSLKSGTLTGSITCTATAEVLTFSANFDSSLTAPTVTLYYRFDSTDAATAITPG